MSSPSQPDICGRVAQVRLETAGPRGKASFAKSLGLSPSTYDYYEADRVPPADVLVRIAEVGGVDLHWLLTGKPAAGDRVAAAHPVLQRAAQLLSRSPQSAGPLAAFLDILSQAMTFPMDKVQPGRQAAAGDAGAGAEPALPANAAPAPAVPPSGAAPAMPGSPASPPPAGQADASSSAAPARHDWIPILGRSAAGVVQFWSPEDSQSGLATLSKVLARHAAWLAGPQQPAQAQDEEGSQAVQVITLRSPAEGQTAEFLAASAIKARYADAFALRIDGESMAPEIRHGDLVLLSPSVPAQDGRAAVVQLRRQIGVTCKLYRRDGQTVHLVPVNEEYQPQAFPASQVEWALRVLARIRVGR